MKKQLSSLGVQLRNKLLEQAIDLARNGLYVESANKFEQSGAQPNDSACDTSILAYAFYRRALHQLSESNYSRTVQDIETAMKFQRASQQFRSLFQERLTVIRKAPPVELRRFDEAVAERFDTGQSGINLLSEFLCKHELKKANRVRTVVGIDSISALGVYRWAGDIKRNERWSQLIREFKRGDQGLPALFGRILAEHVTSSETCRSWLREIDYIVPVPGSAIKIAERGADIVAMTAKHLSFRLKIPTRTDFLRRKEDSEKSRDVNKSSLMNQYSFVQKKEKEINGRVVLLLDDVMTRGHTAEACSSQLKAFGCTKVFLLVLAFAESTLQSNRRSNETK
ncbi:MAG: ComF family protein [Gammaproteobacteria bacterium]|nr:ComF family protein [Gammaproteobacteria bacterium]MYF02015.1 ComF family protein [Gammaproteobacteria bacterium]MYI77549.1 ComF family protein [Gammaproteobacteria bacterium]